MSGKMATYTLSGSAVDDLADIRHYIARDSPAAANRLIANFFRLFGVLASNPELGMAIPEHQGLRIHSTGNYAIVYRLTGENISIARVLHGARDLDSLLN
jgi:toxin ParE1/3/4